MKCLYDISVKWMEQENKRKKKTLLPLDVIATQHSNTQNWGVFIFCVLFYISSSLPLFSITEHIDFGTPLQEPAAEPLCNANLAASMHTLDHLAGVANRAAIHYTGESQLREVSGGRSHSHTYAPFLFLNTRTKKNQPTGSQKRC